MPREERRMAENYQVLPGYKRFNQKNNAIMRSSWDAKLGSYDPRNERVAELAEEFRASTDESSKT